MLRIETQKQLNSAIQKWTELGNKYGYPKCCIDYFVFRLTLFSTLGIWIPPIGYGYCLCPECAGREEKGMMEVQWKLENSI